MSLATWGNVLYCYSLLGTDLYKKVLATLDSSLYCHYYCMLSCTANNFFLGSSQNTILWDVLGYFYASLKAAWF